MRPSPPPLRAVLFLSALIVAAMPASSRAAHPFITDDSGTQGTGNWQLELLGQRSYLDRTADARAGPVRQESRATLFNPVLTYGLLDNLDLAAGLSHLRYRVTEDGAVTGEASGMSDSTLDLKWRFYESGDFSLALKPSLSLPTGNENRGLGTGRASWGVGLSATYEAGPWTFLGNVAYTRLRFSLPQDEAASRDDLWRLSGGATWSVAEGVRLAGEVGIRTNVARDDPFQPGRNGQFAMLGAIYSPDKKIDLDVGVRKRLNRDEADTVILIGATFRW
jgi:hypothetical protein